MIHEDKELIIKDLCTRLPYGVKVNVIYSNENASSFRQRVCIEGDNELNTDIMGLYRCDEIDIRPYLFPLSSITDEQALELFNIFGLECPSTEEDYIKINEITGITFFLLKGFDVETHLDKLIDWLNKNHFDYRGLIEKSLALDATNLRIY